MIISLYARADGQERLLAGQPFRGRAERLVRVGEAALGRGDVELLLGAEEAEQVRLRDAGLAGDDVGRGALEAALGEHGDRRLEDLLAPLLSRLAWSSP